MKIQPGVTITVTSPKNDASFSVVLSDGLGVVDVAAQLRKLSDYLTSAARKRNGLTDLRLRVEVDMTRGYDVKTKCEAIVAWAGERDNFDTKLVESILKQLKERPGSASPKQEAAVDRIIDGFRIDVEHWA